MREEGSRRKGTRKSKRGHVTWPLGGLGFHSEWDEGRSMKATGRLAHSPGEGHAGWSRVVVVVEIMRNGCILDIFGKERKQDLLTVWVWIMKERSQTSSMKCIQSLVHFKEYFLGTVLCTIICWPLCKAPGVHWSKRDTCPHGAYVLRT